MNRSRRGPGAMLGLFLFLGRARMTPERIKNGWTTIYTFWSNIVRLGATIAALFSLYLGG